LARSGTPKWMTSLPLSGSSTTALVSSRSPAGEPLEKTLRALTRYPPSARIAVPDPANQSEPPLLTSTSLSAATRRSSGSTEVS